MNTLQRPLALIGFPCSGKTTLGRLLAERLQVPWLDSDHEIEIQSGHAPAYWLQTQGEPAFRAIEQNWLQHWQPDKPCILSTGGGLPCFKNNLELLKAKALTIYLAADFDLLYQRLSQPPGHALTHLYDLSALKQLHRDRSLIYQRADVTVAQDIPANMLNFILARI